jgi:adenylate cyclase
MAEERIQRRLAAILAADVVGYSRLMEIPTDYGKMARLRRLGYRTAAEADPRRQHFGAIVL